MKIAVEGCLHGELQKVYDTIAEIEDREKYKVDLLLCCGDFQATRNLSDLKCMAVPDKYKVFNYSIRCCACYPRWYVRTTRV
jgi:lariat debranching enzyme